MNVLEIGLEAADNSAGVQAGEGLQIAVVCARFNEQACEELLDACTDELLRLGVADEDITIVRVPGALEIALALQVLGTTRDPDAMIALGAVVRGETYHFELVANECGSAITQVGLDLEIPIANGVLTTEDDEQAFARTLEKGRDCAQAAVEMARLVAALRDVE